MIVQATIASELVDLLVEPDANWNGETTGATIEVDARRFEQRLRGIANYTWHYYKTASARKLVAFAIWLARQVNEGNVTIAITDFSTVEEYPGQWRDLILIRPDGFTNGGWATCITSIYCPVCQQSYDADVLTEIEYEQFFHGECVLCCPRAHHLFVLGRVGYQGA